MAEPRLIDEWLKKAEEDYQFAASVLEDSTFYAQICFHFHQAAEKYLKAFIITPSVFVSSYSSKLTADKLRVFVIVFPFL